MAAPGFRVYEIWVESTNESPAITTVLSGNLSLATVISKKAEVYPAPFLSRVWASGSTLNLDKIKTLPMPVVLSKKVEVYYS